MEEQLEAFRAESREREDERMAARSAKGPTIEEVSENMEVEGDGGGGGEREGW